MTPERLAELRSLRSRVFSNDWFSSKGLRDLDFHKPDAELIAACKPDVIADLLDSAAELASIRSALRGVLPRVTCPACNGRHRFTCKKCDKDGTIDPVDGPATTLELVERAVKFPQWIVNKLKTMTDYYTPPTDGRNIHSEIQGWMHVLCFHYEQNRREVKEFDAARRRAKELEKDRDRIKAETQEAAAVRVSELRTTSRTSAENLALLEAVRSIRAMP